MCFHDECEIESECVCLIVGVLQDNLGVFLRGCEELGLKGSQLFDPGDLQDTSTRPAAK